MAWSTIRQCTKCKVLRKYMRLCVQRSSSRSVSSKWSQLIYGGSHHTKKSTNTTKTTYWTIATVQPKQNKPCYTYVVNTLHIHSITFVLSIDDAPRTLFVSIWQIMMFDWGRFGMIWHFDSNGGVSDRLTLCWTLSNDNFSFQHTGHLFCCLHILATSEERSIVRHTLGSDFEIYINI